MNRFLGLGILMLMASAESGFGITQGYYQPNPQGYYQPNPQQGYYQPNPNVYYPSQEGIYDEGQGPSYGPYDDQALPPPSTDSGLKRRESTAEIDRNITQKVRQALASDPILGPVSRSLQVFTLRGRVTLRGSVLDNSQKSRIDILARGIPGVSDVDNQLSTDVSTEGY